MGCFYTGFDYKNRKHGYFKIGETSGKTPAARLSTIRQTDCFQCLGYLILINDTDAERVFVESYVRLMIERKMPELKHTQKDHFLYEIFSAETKYQQAYDFAEQILKFAIECCELYNIGYKIGTKKYKRG